MSSSKPITDRDVYRYDLLYGAPEYVKVAAIDELTGAVEDDNRLFADPGTRVYSTRTKAATWVAVAHFVEHAAALPATTRERVAARLDDAARLHGIEAEVALLREKHAGSLATDPAGLPDEAFGWLVKNASGAVVERRLRLLNPIEVKAAAAWLLEHRDRFLLEDRMKIARRVLARAKATCADLDDDADAIEKIAGYGDSALPTVRAAIAMRIQLLRVKKAVAAAEGLAELSAALAENPLALRDRGRRLKVAATLDQMDRDFRLQPHYEHDGLPRPEEALYGVTEKAACDYLAARVEVGGATYEKAAIDAVDPAGLAERLGEALAATLTGGELFVDGAKLAAAAAGRSPAENRLIRQALKAAGVEPLAGAAERPRLTRADLERIADEITE